MRLFLLLGAALLAGCAGVPQDMPFGSSFGAGVDGYLRGVVGEANGDEAAALRGYLDALAEDPRNGVVQNRSLELALMRGDLDTAVRLVKVLPAAEASQTLPGLVRVTGDLLSGKDDAARAVLVALAAKNKGVLQLDAMRNVMRVQAGEDVAKVVAEMERMELPASMDGRRAYYEAQLWEMAGHAKEQEEALKRAHAADPGMVWAVRDLVGLYEAEGKTAAARAVVGDFREANPLTGMDVARLPKAGPRKDARTHVGEMMLDFGLMAWSQGAAVPARQVMTLALALLPRDPYAAYYAGMVEEFGGDLETAAGLYARAERDPDVGLAAQVRLTDVAFKRKKDAEGVRRMRALVRDYPNVAAVRLMAGGWAAARQDWAEAVRNDEALLALLPADTPKEARAAALFSTGAAYERLGVYDKAEARLRESLALAPANAQVMNYLGYMWVEHGKNLDEAMALLRQAQALAPQDGAIMDSVGWAYFVRGDTARALLYMERAAEMEPDDPTVAEHLGDVYAKLGRMEDAKRLWAQALELNVGEAKDDALGARVEKKLKQK